jgi:hypothetical protein
MSFPVTERRSGIEAVLSVLTGRGPAGGHVAARVYGKAFFSLRSIDFLRSRFSE